MSQLPIIQCKPSGLIRANTNETRSVHKASIINANWYEQSYYKHSWIHKTKWPIILNGRDPDWLQSFIHDVDVKKDRKISQLCRSIKRNIHRAYYNTFIGNMTLQVMNQEAFGGSDVNKEGVLVDEMEMSTE